MRQKVEKDQPSNLFLEALRLLPVTAKKIKVCQRLSLHLHQVPAVPMAEDQKRERRSPGRSNLTAWTA
jgi:hypothetical protein